jgi:hypothetical protein
MTEEQKALLEMVAEELGGVVEYKTYCDLKTTHEKVVITYDVKQRRANQVPSRYT